MDRLREEAFQNLRKNLDAALADAAVVRRNAEEDFKFR
jgi:hypothetical protein